MNSCVTATSSVVFLLANESLTRLILLHFLRKLMGGVKKGQPGFGSAGHHHDTVLRLCPPGSPEQLYAGLASSYRATEIVRVWGRGRGRKHRLWTKRRAEWLLEWAAACGLFRGREFGRLSDLLHHLHLLNVKTWLFHFPQSHLRSVVTRMGSVTAGKSKPQY